MSPKPCYFCGATHRSLVVDEVAERRLGRSVIPEGHYKAEACAGCGAFLLDSDIDEGFLTSLYESESVENIPGGPETHDRIVASREPEFRRHADLMLSTRPTRGQDTLLDFGCQTGEFGSIMKARGVAPFGVEMSTEYAGFTRHRWEDDSSVVASLSDFEGRLFDYVSAWETLEHMLDPIAAMSALRQVIAPGGIFGMSVPSAHYFATKARTISALNALGGALGREPQSSGIPHTHIYTFSRRACVVAMERAGFRILYMEPTGWHGRLRSLNAGARRAARALDGRIDFAPSILVLGTPAA